MMASDRGTLPPQPARAAAASDIVEANTCNTTNTMSGARELPRAMTHPPSERPHLSRARARA